MSNLPVSRSTALSVVRGTVVPTLYERMVTRQTSRELTRLEGETTIRISGVQAEGIVQTEKVHEIDGLAREAMAGQAMLRRWADTLAGADPLLADELRFFSDAARVGKGEVLADTIASYCRESRR